MAKTPYRLTFALFLCACTPLVDVDETGNSQDASSGDTPVGTTTDGLDPTTSPSSSAPPMTSGAEESSDAAGGDPSSTTRGESTGEEVFEEVLWEYQASGSIDAMVVDDDDASVWMLVVAQGVVLEHVSSDGELLDTVGVWDGPGASSAIEWRADPGQLVLLAGHPVYGLSWSLHDEGGEYIESVKQIESLGEPPWILQGGQGRLRLGATQTGVVGTEVDEEGALFRFMIDGDGNETWRFSENTAGGPVLQVAGESDGGMTVMTENTMYSYRGDGVPSWGVNLDEGGSSRNLALLPLPGYIGLMQTLIPDDEAESFGGLTFFDLTGDIDPAAFVLPEPTTAFGMDSQGHVYASADDAAIAQFHSEEGRLWSSELAATSQRAFIRIGPSDEIFYATGDTLIRIEH